MTPNNEVREKGWKVKKNDGERLFYVQEMKKSGVFSCFFFSYANAWENVLCRQRLHSQVKTKTQNTRIKNKNQYHHRPYCF